MTTTIKLENVSKKFTLEQSRPRSFQQMLMGLFQQKDRNQDPDQNEFWVLKGVDLEIYSGETLSVVGSNGAGKSTLLKLLTNIVRPTHGKIRITGRISALLELGTGFHPDLTGRENIYLGGTLAGLSRAEVEQNLGKIIDFANVGQFIDVPVRHYSSGMFVRLGFALAIHAKPDILIVDEVLAVGDESFQKKCLEKIREVRNQGSTVILVSHSMNVIRTMSDRVVWMKNGQIEQIGSPDEVIKLYMAEHQTRQANQQTSKINIDPEKAVEIKQVEFLNHEGKSVTILDSGCPATIRIHYHAYQRIESPIFGLAIHRQDDVQINGPNTDISDFSIESIEGPGTMDYNIKFLPLLTGLYFVTVGIFSNTYAITYDFCDREFSFTVKQKNSKEVYGLVYIPATWQQNTDGEA